MVLMFYCVILHAVLSSAKFFQNQLSKNSFRVLNSLNPDQAGHTVLDLDSNCLQRLSADDTSGY